MDAPPAALAELPALRLPFDTEEILAGLTRWVACESPTWDAAACPLCAQGGRPEKPGSRAAS